MSEPDHAHETQPQETPPETTVAGYCRVCGKALDASNIRSARGTIFCQEHVPMDTAPQGSTAGVESPYTASPYVNPAPPPLPNADVSPGLAFILGLIPGVGAIYNGQYAKGLVHALIVGLLITIADSPGMPGPVAAMLIVSFWIYMPFEAYHTARKRRLGEPVDEFSSLAPSGGGSGRIPVAPVVLILLGAIFLLNNLEIFELQRLARYWPVLMIALGVYLLYARMSGRSSRTTTSWPPEGGQS
jgi:hypothetical protein